MIFSTNSQSVAPKYQIGDFLYNAGKSGEAKSYYRTLIKDNKLNSYNYWKNR